MTRPRAALVATAATVAVLCLCWLFWYSRSKASAPPPSSSVAALGPVSAADTSSADDLAPNLVYAHNLLLRKGPNFLIYIRWIRGQMIRAGRQVNLCLAKTRSEWKRGWFTETGRFGIDYRLAG